MAFFNQKCPKCGLISPSQVGYCPSCGARLAGGVRVCGTCGKENRGDARYCGGCGQPLEQSEAPQLMNSRWSRRDDDFAVRVEASDLPGLLKRGIRVEPGTNAMLIDRGANRGVLPPGEYTITTIGQRIGDWLTGNIPDRVTALLVDRTPTDMEFHLGGRFTSDPLPVGMSVRLQVEVGEPAKFLVNMLGGHERISKEAIRQYLYPEVRAVADRWLRSHSLQQLTDEPALASRLELALEEALRATFGQSGLRFLQVRTLELNLEPFEQITGKVARANLINRQQQAQLLLDEAELSKTEAELLNQAELERRLGVARLRLQDAKSANELAAARSELHVLEETARLRASGDISMAGVSAEAELRLKQLKADHQAHLAEVDLASKQNYERLQKEYDLLAIAELTRKVEEQERKAELYERMRQAALDDRINELKSEAQLEAFIDRQDSEKLLKEHERAALIKTWQEQGEDQDKARAHLLAKLDLERQYELRLAELRLRAGLDQDRLDAETSLERTRVERQLGIDSLKYEYTIKRQREEEEFERRKRREQEAYEFEQRRRLDEYQRQKDEDARKAADERRKIETAFRAGEFDEEMRQTRLEGLLGLELLGKMHQEQHEKAQRQFELENRQKLAEWDLQHQRLQMEWEQKWTLIKFDLEREQWRVNQEMQRERDKMAHELKRIETLKGASAEVLIVTAGAEQAGILADLKKTEITAGADIRHSEVRQGMSPEQILAETQPSVLIEKYRAEAAASGNKDLQAMYERILAERREADLARQAAQLDTERRVQEAHRAAMDQANQRAEDITAAWKTATAQGKETSERAMDRLADTAQAFARSQPAGPGQQAAPPIIITPSAGGTPQVVYTSGAPAGQPPQAAEPTTKNCPKCQKQVGYHDPFCKHCGHKFEGMG